MGYCREAEEVSTSNAAEGSGQETYQDGCGDLEDIAIELGLGSYDELEESDKAAETEGQREVNKAGAEGERCSSNTGEAEDEDSDPDVELVLGLDKSIQAFDSLVHRDNVVDNFLVDMVGVAKFAKVDSLRCANHSNFSRVYGSVVEADNHAART